MAKYLYGASVQGIQDFIFKTNKLTEIIGASEIVKKITIDKYKPDEIIMQAAGNIKAIFHDKSKLAEVVKNFPKEVMQKAYGITISQTVVVISTDEPTKEDLNTLEKQLKMQRNKPSIPLDLHINILELYPKTARPSWGDSKEKLDVATQQKSDAYTQWFNKEKDKNPSLKELKELTALSNGKNKIAVIHADGNGLGELIPHLKEKTGLTLTAFSTKLDSATNKAFERAKEKKEKIRPVILGGDDMTVVCDANIALEFTKDFLQYFEEETQKQIGYKLTACAGIAYSNNKYPLHYALHLAEALTGQTKKHAKALRETQKLEFVPSSLMFHNIQSSNFQSWDKFVADELTIKNNQEKIRLDFGPYYLEHKEQPQIQDFIYTIEAYRCENSPISRLRSWLSELYKDHQSAKDMLERINSITQEKDRWNCEIMDNNLKIFHKELSHDNLIIEKDTLQKTPIYDVLQIISTTEAKQ